MNLVLRASMIEVVADADPKNRWNTSWLEVTTLGTAITQPRWKACVPAYLMMCEAIMADIQNPLGSGASELENIRRVESGETDLIEAGGNAWYTHIERERVWFEGQYGQGEGGAVSLQQYKLAVETYVRFLADPERRTIELQFP
jgi:hypothetical protein